MKPLHPDSSLSGAKLKGMEQLQTETLERSLLPGGKDSLKVRPDGTILDGHHRIRILRDQGVDVDSLPRRPFLGGSDTQSRKQQHVTMKAELYWIDGPWPGKLAIASRPRGNDWLDDEVRAWQASGIEEVVSLLTPDEERELGLEEEAKLCRAHGIAFLPFPIADRSVPPGRAEAMQLIRDVEKKLTQGKTVVLHCRQGMGRAAMMASCLLAFTGLEPEMALARVGQARGLVVPETAEQRSWVIQFAREAALAPARQWAAWNL